MLSTSSSWRVASAARSSCASRARRRPARLRPCTARPVLVRRRRRGSATKFLDTVPIHRRQTDAFLIARHETTYRQWIEFLDALPDGESARYAPHLSAPMRGSLRLDRVGGTWQLTFRPISQRYTARAGEPFVYAGRNQRARQDWLDFPVAGPRPPTSSAICAGCGRPAACRAPACAASSNGSVPRAGRTIGSTPTATICVSRRELRPHLRAGRCGVRADTVGAHPLSRSPFGIDDMAGNFSS